MLTADLIAEIKTLELKARRLTTDAMSGEYVSAFHGRGMELHEVREYVPGDDVRAIDWNVTARTNVPHVKVYREERELTVMIAIDVSASMAATGRRSLSTLSKELAAVLAYLAVRNNDRVGLMLFSDVVEHYCPPRKGRGHIWRIIKELTTHEVKRSHTNLAHALRQLQILQKRRATCFVISDFWGDEITTELSLCARQHDVTCVNLDPNQSAVLPDAGVVQWVDSETGEELIIDTSDPAVRIAYHDAIVERAGYLERVFGRCGVDHFTVSTQQSVVRSLALYLHERDRTKPRRAV